MQTHEISLLDCPTDTRRLCVSLCGYIILRLNSSLSRATLSGAGGGVDTAWWRHLNLEGPGEADQRAAAACIR